MHQKSHKQKKLSFIGLTPLLVYESGLQRIAWRGTVRVSKFENDNYFDFISKGHVPCAF